MNLLRKDSPIFDGANYEIWKEKMKTHLSCMSPGYWILTKSDKTIVKEVQGEECSEVERSIHV